MIMDIRRLIDLLNEEKNPSKKIDRSAFLYLTPQGDKAQFAQCGTCGAFMPKSKRCGLFDKDFEVIAEGSCGLYVHGTPSDDQETTDAVDPKQAGYIIAEVRCENCQHIDGTTCLLFQKLNQELSEFFELDSKVEKNACCNAWQEIKK
jgi:hypothetical protein